MLPRHADSIGLVTASVFLFRVPATLQPYIMAVYGTTCIAWIGRQFQKGCQGKTVNLGKLMIMLFHWVTWAVGALLNHSVVSLAFINLFHGIPSMVIVYQVCQERYAQLRDASKFPNTWLDWV